MFDQRQEKRQHPRYSFKESASLAPFSTVLYSNTRERSVHAQLQDLSQGGFCLRADRGIKRDQVVRCELSLPGIPLPIPTLMRVRWSLKIRQGYLIGMQ